MGLKVHQGGDKEVDSLEQWTVVCLCELVATINLVVDRLETTYYYILK